MWSGADRTREAVFLRGAVELLEKGAALDSCYPLRWIYFNRPHARQIDDHATVARREAGDAVAPTADRNDEIVLAGEADRCDDVLDTSAPRNERGIAIGDRVPDDAPRVVFAVGGQDQLPAEFLTQVSKRGHIDRLRQ